MVTETLTMPWETVVLQRLGCADFTTNSEIRHIWGAEPAKQRKIAEAGNPARTGRTQNALTTDARQDKPEICS